MLLNNGGPILLKTDSFDRFAKRWKMARKNRDIGAEILQGLREIKRGEYGRVISVPDITRVREKTGLSQARFAQLLGVSVRTLQDWEQGRRAPSGAARTLLMVAARNPQALLEVA
jgi:putative transcriptional regulator